MKQHTINSQKHGLKLRVLALLLLLLPTCCAAFAQETPVSASLTVQCAADGANTVLLSINIVPEARPLLQDVLQKTFHGQLQHFRTTLPKGTWSGDTGPYQLFLTADWNTPVLRRGQYREAAVDLNPLLHFLRRLGANSLPMWVYLPHSRKAFCDNGEYKNYSMAYVRYDRRMQTAHEPMPILHFGYDITTLDTKPDTLRPLAFLVLCLIFVRFIQLHYLSRKRANSLPEVVGFPDAEHTGYESAQQLKAAAIAHYSVVSAALIPLLTAGAAVQYSLLPAASSGVVFLLGAAVSFGLFTAIMRWAVYVGKAEAQSLVQAALLPRLLPQGEAHLVGFSPGSTPRTYDGNTVWDGGMLQILPDCLRYVGERVQWTLRRENLVEIRPLRHRVDWVTVPFLAFAWRDAEQYASGVFLLYPNEGASFGEAISRFTALTQQLTAWRLTSETASLLERTPALGLPFTGEVTDRVAALRWTPGRFLSLMQRMLLISGEASIMLGLKFAADGGLPTGWYVVGGMIILSFLWGLPSLCCREPHVPTVPPVPPPSQPAPPPEPPAVPPMPGQIGRFDLQ